MTGRKYFTSILFFGTLALISCQTAPRKTAQTQTPPVQPPGKPKVQAPYDAAYLGVGFKAEKNGLKVDTLYPGTPAWEAGLQIGDILLEADGEPLSHGSATPDEKMIDDFVDQIIVSPIGRVLRLNVLRAHADGKTENLYLEAKLRRREYNPGTKLLPADRLLHPEWEGEAPALPELVAGRLAKHYGFEKDQQELRRRLSDLTVKGDVFRIPEISYVLRNPFRNAQAAEALLARIKPKRGKSAVDAARALISETRKLLDPERATGSANFAPLKIGLTPQAHLEQLEAVLAEVDALWKKAYARLSVGELDFMSAHAKEFLDAVKAGGYLAAAPSQEELLKRLRMIELAGKVDYDSLLLGSLSLLRVADPVFARGLKKDFERSGLKLAQPEVLARKTPFGEIVIGGTTDDWHKDFGSRDIAVLIDLGGNDYYSDGAGASTRKLHASIVVDLEGNDSYEANTDFAQGAGFFGIGILADLGGDDSYIGQTGAQGASFAGVGLLLDSSGDDVYRAQAVAQGAGFWGLGALIDLSGDDRYESHLLSQAVGIAGGIGALVDAQGDDQYYATGLVASEYGTPGTFNALSQGVGFGLRGMASGGLGILYDGQGADRFEAGDFSQGGGYYFGWGIFKNDGQEDDVYLGSRYDQGFSAHYGVGTFIEQGGNDVYKSIDGVASGMSMDLSTTWFEDRGGNDRYEAKYFSLGSSAHNSLTVFIDRGGRRGGRKTYAGPSPRASVQGNYYHGGTSLSLVFDEGAAQDRLVARDDYVFVFDLKGPLARLNEAKFFDSLLSPLQTSLETRAP